MLDWLWDEQYWFPATNRLGPKMTWKDLENASGSKEYMPQVWHLHWALIMGFFLLGVRVLVNRWVVVPLAVYLGVPKKERPTVNRVPVLDATYNKTKHFDHVTIQSLSKQTDMTTRQVEIWLRKRRQQDVPTPIQKFTECSWHFVFYGIAFVYGLYIVWDKPWFSKTVNCWMGYPRQHVSDDVYWYYMIELGFYWSLIFTLFTDHKRKDFTEMIIHHIATLVLMYFSWMMNYVRLGTLVLLVHDASDPWLALAKMCKYLHFTKATDACFVVFLVIWIVTRLIIYPFVILYCSTVEPYVIIEKTFFSHQFLNFFLYVLFVLHIMWSYSIFKILINKLRQGEVNDVRSDSDDDIDFSSDIDNESKHTNGVSHS